MKRLLFSVIPVIILCVIFSMVVSPEINRAVLDTMESLGGIKSFCDSIFNNLIKSWWSKEPFVNFRPIVVIVVGFAVLLVYYLTVVLLETLFKGLSKAITGKAPHRQLAYETGKSFNDRYAEIYNNTPSPKVVSSFQVSALDGYYEGLNPLKYRDLATTHSIVSLSRVEIIKLRNETAEENDPQIMRLIRLFEQEAQKNADEAPRQVETSIPSIVTSGGEVVVDAASGNAWKSLVPVITHERVEAEYSIISSLAYNLLTISNISSLDTPLIDGVTLVDEYDVFLAEAPIEMPPVVLEDVQVSAADVLQENADRREDKRTKLIIPDDYVEEVHLEDGNEVIYYRNTLTGEYVQPVIYKDEVIWVIVRDGAIVRQADVQEGQLIEKKVVEEVKPAVVPEVKAVAAPERSRRSRNVGEADSFFTDISQVQVKEEREQEFPFVQGIRPRKKVTLEDILSDGGRKRVRRTQFTFAGQEGK